MDQSIVVTRGAAHERLRAFLIAAIEFIDELPAMRPKWFALDAAIVVLIIVPML